MAAPVYSNPHHFGLVVGINRYPDKGLGHLHHARNDALGFFRWLTDPAGGSVPPRNCKLIVVNDKDMPDNRPIERAIPDCLRLDRAIEAMGKRGDALFDGDREAWEGSRLYYYVSGHGLGKGTNDAWLLAANAGPKLGWGWHVSCDRVLQYFARLQCFRELVVFADCCRDEKPGVEVRALSCDKGERRRRGRVWEAVGFGARPGEQSLEPPDADGRRGYFTEALLRGLQGEAAPPGGEINCTNLATFIGLRVRQRTEGRQEADIKPSAVRPIVFRPALPPPPPIQYKASLHFGGFAGRVQLIGEGLRPIGGPRLIASGDVWEVLLPTGMYQVESVPAGTVFVHEGWFKVVGGDCRVEF